MTATVINPAASLNPSSLSFGNQKSGTTSASKTITLTNTGTTQLTLSTVSISGNFALASGTTCAHNTALAPNANCLIKVTFTPTSKGSKSGTVTVTDNALHGTSTAGLSGSGN
jgi:Abnormal spindle-like microcephaly-assoc'd, ASPM-SPD-2-Hydin